VPDLAHEDPAVRAVRTVDVDDRVEDHELEVVEPLDRGSD
jgi:hypothetical protein